MPNTYVDYPATAGQTDFAFSFPYLEDSHVVVEVEGVNQTLTTNYTIETSPAQKIVLSSPTTAIAGGELVRVKRVSAPDENLVDFVNGSVLTETELDRAYLHNRYLSEEAYDGVNAGLGELEGSTNYNANNKQIKNLADGTLATDAVNKGYVDTQIALTDTNLAGFFKSTHTGNGTDNVFTLSFTPQTTEAEAYIVSIDGLVQVPDTDYTIGATDITFNTIPANSAEICVVATAGSSVATVNEAQVTATGSTTARSLADRFADVVNVLDYGVKNDGTEPSGDSNATRIQAAINASSHTVYFPKGTYNVTSVLTVSSKVLDLDGSTLSASVAGQKVATVTSGGIINGIIDGNDLNHTTSPIELLAGDGAVLSDLVIRDFQGNLATFQTYALTLPLFDCTNFLIRNVVVDNISQEDDGVVVNEGFCGALFFTSSSTGTETSSGLVQNFKGNNIRSIDSGSGVVQDSDLIRMFYTGTSSDLNNMRWNIKFVDITANEIGKRVFKTGGIHGCTIDNLICNRTNFISDDMYALVDLTNESKYWVISNVNGKGYFARGIVVTGEQHSISNVNLESLSSDAGNYGVMLGNVGAVATGVVFKGLNLYGFASGIYFYDAYKCEVSNTIIRADSLAVLTNNTSGNNQNTINDGTFYNAGISIQGGAFLYLNNIKILDFVVDSGAYPFTLTNGETRIRGLFISAASGRRIFNLALQSGQNCDMDDVTLVRTTNGSQITNDHNIFSMVDAQSGGILRVGTLRVTSLQNPTGTPSGSEGRANVLIKNCNYNIDRLEIIDEVARGAVGNELIVSGAEGRCYIKTLKVNSETPTTNVAIAASTSSTVVDTLMLATSTSSSITANVGTVYLQGGATVGNIVNTPTTITIT